MNKPRKLIEFYVKLRCSKCGDETMEQFNSFEYGHSRTCELCETQDKVGNMIVLQDDTAGVK